MDAQIVDILHHIPEWDAAKAVVTPMTGSITNQNYRVDIGGETLV